jgi:hypothetical protein
MKNSPLAVRLYVLSLFIQPLSAIRWQWVESDCQGDCLRRSKGSWKPPCLYDGKAPRISLIPQTIRQGHQRLDPEHSYWFLPPSVKGWLIYLGIVTPQGDMLHCECSLSITCVVHQPCQDRLGESDRLWYRADIGREGVVREGTILLIPLTPGHIDFVQHADASKDPNASAFPSLPECFTKRVFPWKRVFPFLDAGDQHWFQTRISEADNFSPFAFVSLVICALPMEVLVAIEIIPPLGQGWDNMQLIGGLLGHFANCSCICEARSANIFDGSRSMIERCMIDNLCGPFDLDDPRRHPPTSGRPLKLVPPNQSSATQNLRPTLPLKRRNWLYESSDESSDVFEGSSSSSVRGRAPLKPMPPNQSSATQKPVPPSFATQKPVPPSQSSARREPASRRSLPSSGPVPPNQSSARQKPIPPSQSSATQKPVPPNQSSATQNLRATLPSKLGNDIFDGSSSGGPASQRSLASRRSLPSSGPVFPHQSPATQKPTPPSQSSATPKPVPPNQSPAMQNLRATLPLEN